MKAGEVLKILGISRPTLTKYVREGKIIVEELDNGRYDYDQESVYIVTNKGVERKTYIYTRVLTSKQKPYLENQVEMLKQFCFSNRCKIGAIFFDVVSGTSFEKRKALRGSR